MDTPLHLEAIIERDLNEIRNRVRAMSGLVLQALRDAVRALRQRDRRLAYKVILGDNRIDAMEGLVDRLCQEFLVRHMPVAAQLRFIIAATRVNSELERIGDYADAIAHRTVQLVGASELPLVDQMADMANLSIQVLEEAMVGFLQDDATRMERARELEAEVDEANRRIFDALSHPEHGEHDLTLRFALLGILNRIERVADRACNIAEEAVYAVKGEVVRHTLDREMKVLLLSVRDAALGPMTEAIARRSAPLRFRFTSAGIEPTALDPIMVSFMAKRGIEVTRPHSRGLEEVGPLDEFYVVVLLSKEAEEICPPLPYKTVALTWDIFDPTRTEGTPQEIEAAYARTYTEIDAKLGDLIAAMSGGDPDTPENP